MSVTVEGGSVSQSPESANVISCLSGLSLRDCTIIITILIIIIFFIIIIIMQDHSDTGDGGGCSGSSVGTEINSMQLPVEADKVKNGRWSLNRDQALLREWIFNTGRWEKMNVLLLFHRFPTVLSRVAIIFF